MQTEKLFNRFAKMAKVTSGTSNLHSEKKILEGFSYLISDSKMTLGVRNLPFLSSHQLRINDPMIRFGSIDHLVFVKKFEGLLFTIFLPTQILNASYAIE